MIQASSAFPTEGVRALPQQCPFIGSFVLLAGRVSLPLFSPRIKTNRKCPNACPC